MQYRGISYIKVFLFFITFVAFVRLIGFTLVFGEKSLQLDFSAFYTAGESVNAHLSPYKNHVAQSPPIWDGYNIYKHSRFLYPPLVAYIFSFVSLLSYHAAKYLWMYLSLTAVIAALLLSFKASDIKLDIKKGLIVLFLLFIFHPLIKLLAFGQISAVTLFFMILGIYLICKKKHEGLAGLFFAIAVLLKLHNLLILPFILLRKKWKVLGGFVSGGFTIFILTLIFCGPAQIISYVTVDLPRIAAYGELGTKDMMLPESLVSSLHNEQGITIKDGREYPLSREGFNWAEYATLTQTPIGDLIRGLFSELKLYNSQAIISGLIFIILFGLLSLKEFKLGLGADKTQYHEFLFWQFAFVVILLSAPLTWDMNTVWLITLFPIVVSGLLDSRSPLIRFSYILISVGLIVVAVPNFRFFPLLVPFGFLSDINKYQYIIGEIIILAGFFIFPFDRKSDHPENSLAS